MDAENLGLPILAVGALAMDPIIEAFGPQRKDIFPLSIAQDSYTPTRDELLEIAQRAQGMRDEEKAMHVIKKNPDGTWTYRRLSWTQGSTWYPIAGLLHVILERL